MPELDLVAQQHYEGTLVFDDPEWYLDTGSEVTVLHFGNRDYLESLDIGLAAGEIAEVAAARRSEDTTRA